MGGRLAAVLTFALLAAAAREAPAVEQLTIGNTAVIVRTVTGTFDEERRLLELQDDVYHPGFPIWVSPTRPNIAGIRADTRVPVFIRRVHRDPTIRLRLSR